MSDARGRGPSLMILIAGPYRSGTGDDPAKMKANVDAMEEFALPLFRAGHIPIVGEWLALPMVARAGSTRVGDAAFDEVFHPVAERLVARCDAVLRVGGASAGADEMVRLAQAEGRAVFRGLEEVPGAATSASAGSRYRSRPPRSPARGGPRYRGSRGRAGVRRRKPTRRR